MKRLLVSFTVLGLVAFSAGLAKAQYLIGGPAQGSDPPGSTSHNNGNLDLTHAVDVTGTGFFLPHPSVWVNIGFKTLSGPYQDDLSSEPWAGPAPTPVTTDNFLNLPNPEGCGNTATDGDCGVFFKAFGGNITTGDLANGILYQDNPAVAGTTYLLQGWAGAEANYSGLIPGPTQSLMTLEFRDASNSVIGVPSILDLAAAGLGVPNGQAFNYKRYSLQATAPAGTVSVRAAIEMLNGYSNPAGGGQAFVVDDFVLGAVPEPTTIGLGLLGAVGLLGFGRRR